MARTAAIQIDPEFKSLIPPLSIDEFEQLEKNIEADGCRDPLVRWGDLLVDGHNRYEICNRIGIEYQTVERHFDSRDDAKVWIIENQFGRRNLADIDRIALAKKRQDILRPVAEANRVEAGKQTGRGNKKVLAKSPKPLDTRKEAAKLAGVGEKKYNEGKLVLDAADKGERSTPILGASMQSASTPGTRTGRSLAQT